MMTLAAAAAASLIDLRHSIRMRKKCGGGIWDRFNKVHRSMSLTDTIKPQMGNSHSSSVERPPLDKETMVSNPYKCWVSICIFSNLPLTRILIEEQQQCSCAPGEAQEK